MKKPACAAAIGSLTGLTAVCLPVRADVIVGTLDDSENSCTQVSIVMGGFDCTYAAQRLDEVANGWSGPAFGAGYYTVGSPQAVTSYTPTPGDPKIEPAITGNLTVSGSGVGAEVSGSIVIGPAARNVTLGDSDRAVETWTSLTQTLAGTAVSTASANTAGGFDYVIGANGVPGALCLSADLADCFASEGGADPLDGPTGVWNNGTPPTVGIERSPVTGGADPNVGATTSGSFTGYTCTSTDVSACDDSPLLWGAAEDPGWDNLILHLSTDGQGNLIGGEGWWTQEYTQAIGPPESQTGDNAWQAGHFVFTGEGVPVIPLPPAVWLFGSALGVLGIAQFRRRSDTP